MHTGFGHYGETVLITNEDDEGILGDIFGDHLYSIRKTHHSTLSKQPYFLKGRFVDCVKELFEEMNKNILVISLTQEIGTQCFPVLLRSLRNENAEWRSSTVIKTCCDLSCKDTSCCDKKSEKCDETCKEDPSCCKTSCHESKGKKLLCDAFYPHCEKWRKSNLDNSFCVLSKVIDFKK